jgi:hypothetical protein
MEFYSAIKKNEIMWFTGKWVKMEIIILRAKRQYSKDKYCRFPLVCGSYQSKISHDNKMEATREGRGKGKGKIRQSNEGRI